MKSNKQLWNRIKAYSIGLDDNALFMEKLMNENQWSQSFCIKVIDEYKKFMYLACMSTIPVTPSKIIDRVWHLHLIFSRCYWKHFCPEVLHKTIHHDPSPVEQAESMGIWGIVPRITGRRKFRKRSFLPQYHLD